MGVLVPEMLGGNYGSFSGPKSSKQGVPVDVSFLLGFWHLGVQNIRVGGLRFGLGLDRLRVLVPLVAWVQVGSGWCASRFWQQFCSVQVLTLVGCC